MDRGTVDEGKVMPGVSGVARSPSGSRTGATRVEEDRSAAHPRGQTFALLATAILILGVNWPLNKIGLRSVGPLWFSALRVGGAAAAVALLTLVTGRLRLPPRQDWPVVLSVGLVRIAGVACLSFIAVQVVPPGRSSVLVWTASLWTVPIAAVVLRERMSPLRWIGLAVGISGIVLLFEPWRFQWSDREVLVGHGLLLLAAIFNASVAVHMRAHRWKASPLDLMPWQLLAGAALLLVVALVGEGKPAVDWSFGFGGNLLFQCLLASGFAIWAQQTVLQCLPAISTTLMMMAIPVVGLVSSVAILGESVTAVGMLGVTAILGGVAASATADMRGMPVGP
jgi:drug/metabolite transporter (DMT)-like permease